MAGFRDPDGHYVSLMSEVPLGARAPVFSVPADAAPITAEDVRRALDDD